MNSPKPLAKFEYVIDRKIPFTKFHIQIICSYDKNDTNCVYTFENSWYTNIGFTLRIAVLKAYFQFDIYDPAYFFEN